MWRRGNRGWSWSTAEWSGCSTSAGRFTRSTTSACIAAVRCTKAVWAAGSSPARGTGGSTTSRPARSFRIPQSASPNTPRASSAAMCRSVSRIEYGGATAIRERCDNRFLRILYAIHDFLPRHHAGSEIYAFELCGALSSRHDVTILCAEYDPTRANGQSAWKTYQGLPVVELVNNWNCDTFADSYRSPWMTDRIAHVLRAVQPDVVHVHNLLNLSFDLPDLAHRR